MVASWLPRIGSKTAPANVRRTRVVTAGVVSETVFREADPRLERIVQGEYQG